MQNHRYSLPPFEKAINATIGFIFYYRLVFVTLAIVAIVTIAIRVWVTSINDDKLRNAALVLTGGSIIVGIFYSIINYEHNQLKFKHDVKTSRELLTFNTASKMHELAMIANIRAVKLFYDEHKGLFVQNRCNEIDSQLCLRPDTRASFIVLFNYFEAISIGVNQEIMDETFMKEFFKTIFADYFSYYDTYIEYLRKETNSPRIFRHCTNLAEKWAKQN